MSAYVSMLLRGFLNQVGWHRRTECFVPAEFRKGSAGFLFMNKAYFDSAVAMNKLHIAVVACLIYYNDKSVLKSEPKFI